MKRPHLLRVEAEAETFASLVRTAGEAGVRVGWLDLGPAGAPAELTGAADLGVLRAVAVGGDRTISVKPRSGPPVLGDLLREHFLGCGVVLIRGDLEAPLLLAADSPDGGGWWILRRANGSGSSLDTQALVKRLRSPRPLERPASGGC